MSNATSPPRSSSVALEEEEGRTEDFLLQESDIDTSMDQSYISNGREDGSGDSEGRDGNKQKRKRTSPKDQAILEAEYKQNPKPNKAARAEIVVKVDLNEKEVQNRRQINRRKSRPLLPHEIAAYGLGGMAALSSDPVSMLLFESGQYEEELVFNSQEQPVARQDHNESSSVEDEVEDQRPTSAEEAPEVSQIRVVDSALPSMQEKASVEHAHPALRRETSGILTTEASSVSITENVFKSFSSTPGYLANRWNTINTSFSSPVASQPAHFSTPPTFTASQPASCPERIDDCVFTPTTTVRISLSLDGKAELVTSSPSPPRRYAPRPASPSPAPFMPQRRIGVLQRSQSAISTPRPSMTKAQTSFAPRLPAGRSQDARTWESLCESEVRDTLTLQAESESSGSAVAAISLIRSRSNSALKPNSNKRNAPTLKHDLNNQLGKKPKLGRSASSLARIQSPVKSSKPVQEPPAPDKDGLLRSPSGDSDKENWVPNEGGGNRRRPLPSSRTSSESNLRTTLPNNGQTKSLFRNRKRKSAQTATDVYEDPENAAAVPEDVEQFMRGEISPSKKGDLDCIQGLLSLSQGNWR